MKSGRKGKLFNEMQHTRRSVQVSFVLGDEVNSRDSWFEYLGLLRHIALEGTRRKCVEMTYAIINHPTNNPEIEIVFILYPRQRKPLCITRCILKKCPKKTHLI